MSTLDDHGKEIIKKQNNGSGGAIIILFFILGVFASLIVGWVIFPKLLYSQKKQPIDFNHVIHVAEVENGCESCHFLRKDGTFSGSPKLEQCVDCHEEIQGVDPDEIKFVEEYVSKGREVPWLVYARQPDCVFFSHAAHIKGGEVTQGWSRHRWLRRVWHDGLVSDPDIGPPGPDFKGPHRPSACSR